MRFVDSLGLALKSPNFGENFNDWFLFIQVVLSVQSSNLYPYNSLVALDDVSILPHSCNGPCSRNACPLEGSVCVEPTSGGHYCLCPPGKAGSNCDKYGKN